MVMLSPSVETAEKDYSTYVAQVSSVIVGMVGGAIKGEVDKPMLITSPRQFLQKLGDPTSDSLATYAALQFLQEGNMLWYVRVADGDEAESTLTVEDSELTPEPLLTINAKTPGTWGDDIKVYIKDVESDEFTLEVEYDGVVVESFECSYDDTSDKYVEDVVDSEYIDVVDSQDGSGTSIEEISDGEYLQGGDNGLSSLTDSNIIGSSTEEGLQNFKNTELYDINILLVPSKSALAGVSAEMLSICQNRGDCMAIIDPPMGLDVQEVVDWHNGEGGGEDDPSQALNSSYGALYYPWLQISDPYYDTERWIPPSGFVAAQYAYNDREANTWSAPAGLNRGRIIRAIDIEHSPTKGERDLMYGNGNAVNPIVNFVGEGITIWGQRTLQREPSALDRVNVRRLLLMIRKAIAATTRYVVFEPNDEFTWRRWEGMIRPYLESLKNGRAFYDYRIQVGLDTTMTTSDIDQNRMKGRILVKPTKTAEFISVDFVLLSTGAEFPE